MRPFQVITAQSVSVTCMHDDYSVWFDVVGPMRAVVVASSSPASSALQPHSCVSHVTGPVCTCSHHAIVSPAVLLQRHWQAAYWTHYSQSVQRALASLVPPSTSTALPTVLHATGGGSLALVTGMSHQVSSVLCDGLVCELETRAFCAP
jgi:hypothetical protein